MKHFPLTCTLCFVCCRLVAFEAFWNGSWKPVERLNINNGYFTTHIVNNGSVVEEDVPMTHLRVRSRRAIPSDCISFLRQGVDICVFSKPPHNPDDSDDDEKNDEPVSTIR